MTLRILAFILLLISVPSCQKMPSISKQEHPDKQTAANCIRNRVAFKLKEECDLRPIGTMGQMMDKVQKLGLKFYYYKPADIAEARRLVIKAAQTMMDEMNNDEDIRPYLGQYPVRPWNVEMTIFLRQPDGRDVPYGELWGADIMDGNLWYQVEEANTRRLKTIYKETFEEAVARVNDPSLPMVAYTPDPAPPKEALNKLSQSTLFIGDDCKILHLDENGNWVP